MFKPVPVAIGLRYLRAKRRNGFISFISLASILGIALGVTALITTLAVMSGFQKEIRDRMLGMAAHATVSGYGEPLQDWQHAVQVAMRDPRVAGAAPYIEKEALISAANNQPAMLRAVIPAEEGKVSVLPQKMVQGKLTQLTPGSFNIVLGRELALWLGVGVGDDVIVTLADFRSTPVGGVQTMKRFKVSGIFEAGYNEFDKGLAVVNLTDLQRVLRMGEGVTGVRLRLHDMDQAFAVARALALNLKGPYRVSDWSEENANLFRALKMEKTVMAILLSLIIAMGAFNLVSSQVMLVTDKQADIAILRTLGLTPAQVMRVFMVQGSLIGVIGTVVGVIGGIVLTLNLGAILKGIEHIFGIQLLPEDVYYITGLPIDLQSGDVVTIACVALAMAFLATLYPAWRAARTAPAEALRYE
ncbi:MULTISPECIES: lipoprotein-releasing ABC transporter permease subunit [Thermomonas]|jgi:lipoprotein-releasing system permease protein|uniref:Lipoprotein-releasing ABC transporter permease subunit n=1 Tax=Thermomonas beijingensis TaxID=2872701 RepID=A0ABS7TFE7_9GAMM|nr:MULTISPECIES: lipoprotein-releasing ABC transporter permease subunit [Thermomonas]MBS0458963.1 lipoprotein-releasing ABC transporter permease subunit [Pseudomonadota bacterium]MDE2382437.1 lipoprotein-releasing ABC transporter permease subunit [Xanthomonadaceae bacterium]MBZ4186605.1 lipoprotein-releasing ABC transporter permease subunit [Thermomonas beijingensis]HOC10441.1 lipoprotein-releasing ABC transporter permease subunit [Thermomonas sp.]HQA02106.1 lipoprotein-releasing ABC transport